LDLKVDGGMTANALLMQFQADVTGRRVVRPMVAETTALGAAYAAGLAVGYWKDTAELAQHWEMSRSWTPSMPAEAVALTLRAGERDTEGECEVLRLGRGLPEALPLPRPRPAPPLPLTLLLRLLLALVLGHLDNRALAVAQAVRDGLGVGRAEGSGVGLPVGLLLSLPLPRAMLEEGLPLASSEAERAVRRRTRHWLSTSAALGSAL
jgi:hypothetical protein